MSQVLGIFCLVVQRAVQWMPFLSAALVARIAICLVVISRGVADGRCNSSLTQSNLRQAFRAQALKVSSLYIIERHHDSLKPEHSYSRRVLCVMEGGYLFHELAHASAEYDWQQDPFRKRSYLRRGKVLTFFPLTRTFKTAVFPKGTQLPMYAFGGYLIAIGLWPQGFWAPPDWDGKPVTLRDIADDISTELRIEKRLQRVNGVWCHVVHYGQSQTIWVDADRGCCLVARLFDQVGNAPFSKRFDFLQHSEVVVGLWLPTQLLITLADAKSGSIRKGLTLVDTVEVNTVNERFFGFDLPAGAFRDDGEDPTQVVPGGHDVLNGVASWLSTTSQNGGRRHGASMHLRSWLFLAVLIVCLTEIASRCASRLVPGSKRVTLNLLGKRNG